MGIRNKEGALYMATGIDNTGLYSGRKEAMGIIKAMAGEITSFDVFGGIGISAGIAFTKAAAESYKFEKQFQQSMKEVATLSSGIKGNLADWMNQVSELTTKIPIGANDAAKALYQVVSAGHDGADGMMILEEAAKAAVGGVTDTATAADAITTVLNAYKKDASEAGKVSDYLFTTVRLGKTDFSQLGQSIAQVAPIAASYGVEMDQVLAAVASLTKQGTPTAQAMTQIRAAIIGTSKVLGDGAFEGRTFQDALNKVADMAGGSESKLRELMPEIEGVNGLLGLTGRNAKTAAQDLASMANSTSAAEVAFKEMASSAENQTKIFANNITNALRPLGSAIVKEISDMAQAFNEAFDNGDIQRSAKALGEIIVVLTSAMIGYKGSIVAVTTTKTLHKAVTAMLNKERMIESANLVLNKGLYAAEATMVAKNTSAHVLLTNALKAQFVQMGKNAIAFAANPYVLAAAGVAVLGYAVYEHVTRATEAEKAQKAYNDRVAESQNAIAESKAKLSELVNTINDENSSNTERNKALNDLKTSYNAIFQKYVDEKGHIADLIGLWKDYNAEVNKRHAESNKKIASDTANDLYDLQQRREKAVNGGNWSKVKELNDAIKVAQKQSEQAKQAVSDDNFNKWKESLKDKTDEQIKEEKAAAQRILSARKAGKSPTNVPSYMNNLTNAELRRGINAYGEVQSSRAQETTEQSTYQKDLQKAKKNWQDAKKEYERIIKDQKVTSQEVKKARMSLTMAESAYKDLTGKDPDAKDDLIAKANEVKSQSEAIKEMQRKQSLDVQRQNEDLRNQEEQSEINTLKDGSEKTLRQRELNNKLEIQALQRQKEDYIIAYTQAQKDMFDAEEDLKAKKNKNYKKKSFDFSSVSVNTSAFDNIISNTKSRQGNDALKEQEESWNEYLLKFGDYQQKRAAIINKYDKEIAQNQNDPGKVAIAEKEKLNALDELDNSVKDSTTLMGQLFADASHKSVVEIQKIIDKAETLMKYLSGDSGISKETAIELGVSDNTLNNLKNSPEQVEALGNAIKNLKGDLGSKSPFLLMKGQIKDAVALLKKGGKENVAQGITEIGSAITQFAPAASQFGKDLGNIFGSDDIGSKISGVVDAFGGLGQTAAGVGQIMSGDVVGGAMAAVQGISQVVSALDGLFGADYSQYNKMKEEYDSLNKVWDEIISKKEKYIDIDYGDEARKVAQETEDLLNKKMQSNYTLGIERLNSGASGGSHSIGVRQRKRINSEGWSELRDASKNIGFNYNSVADGRMEGLFKLSAEQLEQLQEQAPTFWSKLDEDVQEYLQNIIDCGDEIEQMKEKLKEATTGISFDSFYDNFISTLSDMDKSSKDMADDFGEYLKNSILSNLIANKYRDKIQALYDDWANKSDNNGDGIYDLTSEEAQQLKDAQQALAEQMIAERDSMADAFGWSSSSSSQNSTSKGFETMSQDTGEELNGRFTAIQASNEEIKQQMIIQSGLSADQVRVLQELYSMTFDNFEERHEQMVNIIDYLQGIKKDTGNLPEMKALLEEIRNNTK